jgi:prepilin-type N-terminal cleavage/methylation domain-containing protein
MIRSLPKFHSKCGFTLIELIIYISISSIIFSSGLVAMYAVLDTSAESNQFANEQQELYFVIRKIQLATQIIQTIQAPLAGSSTPILKATVIGQNGSLTASLQNSRLVLNMGTTSTFLNSSQVPIQSLIFTVAQSAGSQPGLLTMSLVSKNKQYVVALFPLHE